MKPFTAADIDTGYTAVTPRLFIGKPPFTAALTYSPEVAARLINAGHTVCVMGSEIAHATLLLLGLSTEDADERLRLARFGPLATD